MSTTASKPPPEFFTAQTIFSLLSTVLIILTAYIASLRLLPKGTSTKLRTLYIWHIADGITHLTLEASYLYNCLFVSIPHPLPTSDYPHPASLGSSSSSPGPIPGLNVGTPAVLYADRNNLYGPAYGTNPTARLWQEYAKADRRWGGADLNVIALEILTVGIAGPLALYIGGLIKQGAGGNAREGGRGGGGGKSAKMWFWAAVLATGEIYGGWMTFAPEWLSGNENLDGSNAVYMWLYLFFFNMLWVFFPVWVLYEAYQNMSSAFVAAEGKEVGKKRK